jgi:hemoglobin-like flavoprotein
MGSGLTTARVHSQNVSNRQEIIEIMMPVYYLNNTHVTSEDIRIAKESWSLITDDQSQEFLQQKLNNEFQFSSCIGWFYIIYYARLFDIHPLCKPLFTTGIISQGKFLVKMISLSLNQLHDPINFQIVMKGLAMSHCAKGVRSVEYGIVGSVLFYTLQKVLGEQYTESVSHAWTKVYSKMLSIIVPMVVDYELQEDESRRGEGASEGSLAPALAGEGEGGNREINGDEGAQRQGAQSGQRH